MEEGSDDEVEEEEEDSEEEEEDNKEEENMRNVTKRQRFCSNCGENGHNSRTCGEVQ